MKKVENRCGPGMSASWIVSWNHFKYINKLKANSSKTICEIQLHDSECSMDIIVCLDLPNCNAVAAEVKMSRIFLSKVSRQGVSTKPYQPEDQLLPTEPPCGPQQASSIQPTGESCNLTGAKGAIISSGEYSDLLRGCEHFLSMHMKVLFEHHTLSLC